MFKFIVIASLLIGGVFCADADGAAETVNLVNDVNPDGTYSYSFQTSNGIQASESGSGGKATGEVKWVAPDGTPISLTYTADEEGFRPVGDHLPVAPEGPEVPPHVLRLVQYLESHPNNDDGSYKP